MLLCTRQIFKKKYETSTLEQFIEHKLFISLWVIPIFIFLSIVINDISNSH